MLWPEFSWLTGALISRVGTHLHTHFHPQQAQPAPQPELEG